MLGGSLGLIFLDQAFDELEEAGSALSETHDGFGKQTMAGAVAGGVAFALRGDGAFGTGSVGAGGLNLLRGSHRDLIIYHAAKELGLGTFAI